MSRSAVKESDNARILHFWAHMTGMYGHRWTSAFGDSALDNNKLSHSATVWRRGLADLTTAQIHNGLRQCLETGLAWPPTLPEFRELCCRPVETDSPAYQPPDFLALPQPRPNRDKARPYLQSLRAALKGQAAE